MLINTENKIYSMFCQFTRKINKCAQGETRGLTISSVNNAEFTDIHMHVG